MRRAARIDENQPQIIHALEAVGCIVEDTSRLGNGFPDLVVGRHGVNYMLEVKDGSKPPSKQKLTEDEVRWHSRWRGQVEVVRDVKEALMAIGVYNGRLARIDK